jgi:hypothetical protein
MAKAPVLRSLVETLIATLDAAPEDAGFALRSSQRALDVLRAGAKMRLGAPVLAISDRLLAASDRVLDAGMQSRVYLSAGKLVVQGASAVQESRAKTRARYQRLRTGLARLPVQLHTDLRVYCAARRERLAAISRDGRASLAAKLAHCSALLDAQVGSSKTLCFLAAKARALLVLARLLPAERTEEVPRLISAEHTKHAPQRAVAPPPAAPRTFTSYSTTSAVTPTSLLSAVTGGDISPAMLDSLRRSSTSKSPVEPTNPAPAVALADHVANPASTVSDENVAPEPYTTFFNAEGRGGLWVPSPAKV